MLKIITVMYLLFVPVLVWARPENGCCGPQPVPTLPVWGLILLPILLILVKHFKSK